MDSNENFTQNHSEAILEYLRKQGEQPGESGCFFKEKSPSEDVRDILKDLLDKIETRQALKEEYEFKVTQHNQYPLFKLSEKISYFIIDDEAYDDLTFREILVISEIVGSEYSTEPPVPIGGLCLDIQKAPGETPLTRKTPDLYKEQIFNKIKHQMNKEEERTIKCKEDLDKFEKDLEDVLELQPTKFLVHFSAQFTVDGQKAGSGITSWVDKNLHTIEEKRLEYIYENERVNEKSLHVMLQQGKYFVKHKSNSENFEETRYYSLVKAKEYISEGANFVLMRYMATTRYIGTLELACCYINGDMCRNFYDCKGPESGIVNNKKLDVCHIYRIVTEECGLVHVCFTLLTLEGQILKQHWKNVNVIWNVNPKAKLSNRKPKGNEQILLEHDWQNDMQLYSKYLDAKTENTLKVKSYLSDHPEIGELISDYVQQLLLMKPTTILEFTVNYFKTFAPKYFPDPNYYDFYDDSQEFVVKHYTRVDSNEFYTETT